MNVVCFVFQKKTNLQGIAELFYSYTPQIAISHEAIFLEISQCSLLYSEDEFLSLSEHIFKKLDLYPKTGIGPTACLAYAKAILGTQDLNRIPIYFLRYFLNPFSHVQEQYIKTFEAMEYYFEKLGILRISNFLELNPKQLSSRFGSLGTLLFSRISNQTQPLWPNFIPEEKIIETREFDTEFRLDSIDPLLFILKNFLDLITLRLQARGLTFKLLCLRLIQENISTIKNRIYEIPIELAFTQISQKVLLQMIQEQSQHQLQKRPLEGFLSGVELEVIEVAPYVQTQKNLFNPKKEELAESYFALINRLSLKLGEQSVFKAHLQESYLPEKTWLRETKTVKQKDLEKQILPKRPLRVFQKPILIAPKNGCLFYQQECIDLNSAIDHEVIFSHWWSIDPVYTQRIYFTALSRSGKKFWVFQSGKDFYLHGSFNG
ncbi:MAG: hypothetical protein AB7R69_06320 [Candidatus Babeliales bacterium]